MLIAGFAGPMLLIGSFAGRFGLGWDGTWYLAELRAVGYVPFIVMPLLVIWLAGTGQLAALAAEIDWPATPPHLWRGGARSAPERLKWWSWQGRGRSIAVAVAALLVVAVAWGARQSDGAGAEQSYVVRTGDTLWTIAVKHYAGDPRDAIFRIDRRNHLGGSVLVPGERLVLPSAG